MDRITGARFNSISRCVDMLCLQLGEDVEREYDNSEAINCSSLKRAEFSIHLQTQWRFVHDNQILLASRDIYEPFSEHVGENWAYDLHGRPDHESSVFDVAKRNFEKHMADSFVSACSVSALGDMRITFSNGTVFEVFIPTSQRDEEWRLIDFLHDEHIVFHDIYK